MTQHPGSRVQSGETTTRAQTCPEAATTKESAQEEGRPNDKTTTSQWLTNNEKPQKGQLSRVRVWNGNKWYWCTKETGGKCEGRWVRQPPESCEGKAFRGFNKKGTRKDTSKQEKPKIRSRGKKQLMMGKKKNVTI